MVSLVACSTPVKETNSTQSSQANTTSTNDNSYGYSKENPIKLGNGVFSFGDGSTKEREFLDTLIGPNGEKVTYRRLESCCFFKTPNGYNNGALLEKYEIAYVGLKQPIILYLNMFDPGKTKTIKGLKLKQ